MKILIIGVTMGIGILNTMAQVVEVHRTEVHRTYDDPWDRFYIKADGGVAFVSDVDVERMNGFGLPGSFGVFDEDSLFQLPFDLVGVDISGNGLGTYHLNEPEISWDTGFRVDIAPGYNVNENLSVELELGLIYNEGDELRFGGSFAPDPDLNPEGTASTFKGRTRLDDVSLYQIPILANVVFRVPFDSIVRPYLGGGLGGIATILDWQGDTDTDFTFAYQAMAGIDFELNPNLVLDIGYKFLGTLDHEFEVAGNRVETGGIFTHAVLASVTFRY